MAVDPDKPFNREEMYLAKAAGEGTTVPDEPWSRKEAYLDAIDGRMDGIEEQIAALATDISLKGSVASQADLPETAAVGDAYITEDTGIMYVYVGESGTEPWVALGGSGGGGDIKTLTSADYNYPADNPTSVALWLLPAGVYRVADPDNDQVKIATNIDNYGTNGVKSALFVVLFSSPTSISEYVYILGYAVREHGFARLWTVSRLNGFHIGNFNLLAPINSTGTSQTAPMTQNATTSMVFANPGSNSKVRIGNTNTAGSYAISIGTGAQARGGNAVSIGTNSGGNVTSSGAISIGSGSKATNTSTLSVGMGAVASGYGAIAIGENSVAEANYSVSFGKSIATSAANKGIFDIGTYGATSGYNDTNYRLLTGLYDPQGDHDAATKGYVDAKNLVFYMSVDPAVSASPVSVYSDASCTTPISLRTFFSALRDGKSVCLQYRDGSGEEDHLSSFQIVTSRLTNVDTEDAYNEVSPYAIYYVGSGWKRIGADAVDPDATTGAFNIASQV